MALEENLFRGQTQKWNPQSKYILSTWDCLTEYFLKIDFIQLFEIFYRVLSSIYYIFSKIGLC